jgi:hypothetical protein
MVLGQFSDICGPAKDHKGYDSAVPVTTKIVSSIKYWKIKILFVSVCVYWCPTHIVLYFFILFVFV